jgi:hypothetical protein
VKAQVLAAGFELAGESDVLRNPADDRTKLVFNPAVRGKTDQFALKFRKPKRRASTSVDCRPPFRAGQRAHRRQPAGATRPSRKSRRRGLEEHRRGVGQRRAGRAPRQEQ